VGKISYEGRLDPQMAAAMQKQAELAPGIGEMNKLSLEEMRQLYNHERQYWNANAPELQEIRDGIIAGPVGGIPVRYYFPVSTRPLPALIYLHGGGFIVGNIETHDKIMRLLALHSGAAVVGVDYHLAPEYKFPTALEETVAVIEHLHQYGADEGVVMDQMAVGGDSAGANLSVAASLLLRPQQPDLLKVMLLFYGGYGLRDSGSRRLYGGPEDGMGKEDMAFYQSCYFKGDEDPNDVRFNVLNADLKGLPPMFICAAQYDPLLDDSITLQKIADEAGVPNELRIYEGVVHGFLHLSRMVDKAGQAIEDAAATLRNHLTS